MRIKAKKLTDTAVMPTRHHPTDAGLDLFGDEEVTIKYGETVVVQTNIAIEIPPGYVGDVRPRSGLTLNTSLRVHYGTLDSGYRGSIGIICENASHKGFWEQLQQTIKWLVSAINGEPEYYFRSKGSDTAIGIEKGAKLAQLVIHPIWTGDLDEVAELSEADRGENGFGSTGV